ncbi:hypothetical protein SO802_000797 [Lithocarpus litseifolius]|uniref:Secreted protein n=1 Tax=Lithocarpus litseifolius TaxID=425828 RepID=A0AAW2DSV5_9ROSI
MASGMGLSWCFIVVVMALLKGATLQLQHRHMRIAWVGKFLQIAPITLNGIAVRPFTLVTSYHLTGLGRILFECHTLQLNKIIVQKIPQWS